MSIEPVRCSQNSIGQQPNKELFNGEAGLNYFQRKDLVQGGGWAKLLLEPS